MKKTFLAVLLAGSSIGIFAQTTPTTTPTSPATTPTPTTAPANPTTSPTTPTTSPASPATTSPAYPTTSPTTAPPSNPSTTNGSVTNSTSDPMNTTNTPNPTMNTTNSSWNNGTPANLSWSNYGIWNNNSAVNGMNMNAASGSANASAAGTDYNTTGGSYSSSSGSNASGTSVAAVPYNVQTNYGKDYSAAAASKGTWNQYGDWFYTTYQDHGRYSQIIYDQRGNGYSVALPVLNTYVPENVVAMALQKYGSRLYSITMLKAADGKDAYQINLLNRGQVKPEWIGEDGATAATIYRTEEMSNATGTLTTTQTNAAMDNSGTSGTLANDQSTLNDHPDQDTTGHPMGKKMKSKKHNDDGTVTKTVTKPNGRTKVKTKHKSSMRKDSTSTGNMPQ